MGKPGTLTLDEAWVIAEHVKNPEVAKRIYHEDAVLKHLKSDLGIFIEAKDIPKNPNTNFGPYRFIKGKARLLNIAHNFNNKIEIDCRVACTKLGKLSKFIKNGEVNILDHLDQLLPIGQKGIGLFTFQNGIQNKMTDFEQMGEFIISNLQSEKPLCIGFYNNSDGKLPINLDDLKRMSNEWHLNAHSVLIFRQMIATFAKSISAFLAVSQKSLQKAGAISLRSQLLWTHIAHSEAGLIANEVLTTEKYCLFKQNREMGNFLKNHLITLTYGPVCPIPDVVHFAVNTYSKDDITMFFAKKYLDKRPKPLTNDDAQLMKLAKDMHAQPYFPKAKQSVESLYAQLKSGSDRFFISKYPHTSKKDNYSLTVVQSEVPRSQQPKIEGDHAFAGATYQKALKLNIALLRGKYGIYVNR